MYIRTSNCSVERIEELLSHTLECRKAIHDWFDECEISSPTVNDYIDYDQDFYCGMATILRKVIEEATEIEMMACCDFDCKQYLIYMPSYPWHMTNRDRTLTKEELATVFNKYVSIITDSEIEIDYQEVENGG